MASTIASSPWWLALALGALGGGCAHGVSDEGAEGESEALVAPSVVVADSSATSAAEVLEDRVRLPLAVAAPYRSLAAGSIFVGARGTVTGKNRDGFLRRVVSVSEDGGDLVITTKPAALTDAIVHGALHPSSGGADHGTGTLSVTPLGRNALSGIEIDLTDRPLFEGVDEIAIGGKKARFVESIRLQRAVVSAKPVVDIDLRIRDGKVSRFVAKVEGNLDTSIHATANVTVEGDVDAAILAELRSRKHEVKRVVYQSARLPLPTQAVGGVPISPSVQFTVTLRCELAFGGALVAQAGVEAKSYVRLGAVYNGTAWGPPIRSEFDIKPSFSLDHGGEIDARCAIEANAELSAYGASGITMSVAPYVDFGVKSDGAAEPTYRFRVDAGAGGSMHGGSSVFGVRAEDLEQKLVDWKAPEPLEGSGH